MIDQYEFYFHHFSKALFLREPFYSGIFSFFKSICFFLSKLFLCTFFVYYLASLSWTKLLSRLLPFVLTNSLFSYELCLCIFKILSITSALSINSRGTSSSGRSFLWGFNKCLNIYVTFSATNGTDHSNKSMKLGRK